MKWGKPCVHTLCDHFVFQIKISKTKSECFQPAERALWSATQPELGLHTPPAPSAPDGRDQRYLSSLRVPAATPAELWTGFRPDLKQIVKWGCFKTNSWIGSSCQVASYKWDQTCCSRRSLYFVLLPIYFILLLTNISLFAQGTFWNKEYWQMNSEVLKWPLRQNLCIPGPSACSSPVWQAGRMRASCRCLLERTHRYLGVCSLLARSAAPAGRSPRWLGWPLLALWEKVTVTSTCL